MISRVSFASSASVLLVVVIGAGRALGMASCVSEMSGAFNSGARRIKERTSWALCSVEWPTTSDLMGSVLSWTSAPEPASTAFCFPLDCPPDSVAPSPSGSTGNVSASRCVGGSIAFLTGINPSSGTYPPASIKSCRRDCSSRSRFCFAFSSAAYAQAYFSRLTRFSSCKMSIKDELSSEV